MGRSCSAPGDSAPAERAAGRGAAHAAAPSISTAATEQSFPFRCMSLPPGTVRRCGGSVAAVFRIRAGPHCRLIGGPDTLPVLAAVDGDRRRHSIQGGDMRKIKVITLLAVVVA